MTEHQRQRLAEVAQGDDDSDEVLPRRLAETKRLAGQRVMALQFGGQHAALLTQPGREDVPAARRAADREEERTAAAEEPAAAEEAAVRLSMTPRAMSPGVVKRGNAGDLVRFGPPWRDLPCRQCSVTIARCLASDALPDAPRIAGTTCAE